LAEWSEANRNLIFLALAAAAVTLPIVIGALKGQLPKEIVSSWGIPLAMSTFLLALGVQAIARHLEPLDRLILSLLFACLWISAGLYTSFVQPRRGLPKIYHRDAKNIGAMFTGFGLLWTVVSVFQFFTR
jgi:energy-converting hydrogenase Eha subunit A